MPWHLRVLDFFAAWPATGNGLRQQRLQQLQLWRHHELLPSQHVHQWPAPPGERSPDGTQKPRGRQNERSVLKKQGDSESSFTGGRTNTAHKDLRDLKNLQDLHVRAAFPVQRLSPRASSVLCVFIYFFPIPLYIMDRRHARLALSACLAAALCSVIQASGSKPFRTSPVSILCHRSLPIHSINNRPFKPPTLRSPMNVSRSFQLRTFSQNQNKTVLADSLSSVWLITSPSFFSSHPVQPYGQLVRSLAFPSLQPSLVQTFSPFPLPIMPHTNRKPHAGSGPSAEINNTCGAETQSEYLSQ